MDIHTFGPGCRKAGVFDSDQAVAGDGATEVHRHQSRLLQTSTHDRAEGDAA